MFGLLAVEELVAARYQMALSLGFHIVLSCFGVAFPTMIYVVHRRGIYRGDEVALTLARKWSKVAAVLFAVGAVSGTILSFEMGLLWPGMMETFGDVIGLPFALEGIAFFVEAVFIGIYLFGWDRLPPKVHLRTLIPIIASGLFGTFCILAVNSWMNAPSGFDLVVDASGTLRATDVDPLAAIFNRALWPQFVHMFVATYLVTGFLAASVYAVGILRGRRDHAHRLGFIVPFAFATVAALVQPVIGHVAGMRLATDQPSKLAAMELAVETETNSPLIIGGVLIDGEVRGGIEIPSVGSLARPGLGRPHRARPERVPGRGSATGERRSPVVPDDGRFRLRDDRDRAVVLVEAAVVRPVRVAVAHAGGGRRGRVEPCRSRGRMGHHRGRTSAVDRLQGHARRRRRHRELGDLDQPHRDRGDLYGHECGCRGGPALDGSALARER